MTQNVFFYFDDSGVLHKNDPSTCFVYAGYFFGDKQQKDNALRRYRTLVKEIKKKSKKNGEIKSFGSEVEHKRALYNVMRSQQSVSVQVNIERVYDNILSSKKSIHRYKDYILKRAVKDKLKELILLGKVDPDSDIRIYVFVDEQATATDGFYSLRDSIYEEVKRGISNHDYGTFHVPLFRKDVEVTVEYCDSKHNYLIQASDILANRIWTSYVSNKASLRNIPNHKSLLLP